MASKFKYNTDDNIITNTDLQYLMPHLHKELLFVIIDTYIYIYIYIYGNITKKIKNDTTISLRSDVSVYRTHVDKIYTLAKLIDKVVNKSLICVCLGEPLERGARGIFNTIIKSLENLLKSNVINLIMKEVSSLVTGSTSVNTGHNYGLWKIFQDYIIYIDWRSSMSRRSSTYNMMLCTQVKSGMQGSMQ